MKSKLRTAKINSLLLSPSSNVYGSSGISSKCHLLLSALFDCGWKSNNINRCLIGQSKAGKNQGSSLPDAETTSFHSERNYSSEPHLFTSVNKWGCYNIITNCSCFPTSVRWCVVAGMLKASGPTGLNTHVCRVLRGQNRMGSSWKDLGPVGNSCSFWWRLQTWNDANMFALVHFVMVL